MKLKIKKDTYVVYGELNGIEFEIEDISMEKICKKLYREFVYKKGYSKEIVKLKKTKARKIMFIGECFRYFSSSQEKKYIVETVNEINNSRLIGKNFLYHLGFLEKYIRYSKNPYLRLVCTDWLFSRARKNFSNDRRDIYKKIKYNKKTFDEIVKIYKKEF